MAKCCTRVRIPCTSFSTTSISGLGPGNVQQTLRWPGYARTENYSDWGAGYNGAAVKIEQRPWHGLSFWRRTFSKSIDQASTVNVDVVGRPVQLPHGVRGRRITMPANGFRRRGNMRCHSARARFEQRLWRPTTVPGVGVRGALPPDRLPHRLLRTCPVTGLRCSCSARPDRIGEGKLDKDVRTINHLRSGAFRRTLPVARTSASAIRAQRSDRTGTK